MDANTTVSLDDWSGDANASAYGVGNSALVANVGSDTSLYAIQSNYGAVTANASLSGGRNDGTGTVNATAIGNAATATLCNACGARWLQHRSLLGYMPKQNKPHEKVQLTRYPNSLLPSFLAYVVPYLLPFLPSHLLACLLTYLLAHSYLLPYLLPWSLASLLTSVFTSFLPSLPAYSPTYY